MCRSSSTIECFKGVLRVCEKEALSSDQEQFAPAPRPTCARVAPTARPAHRARAPSRVASFEPTSAREREAMTRSSMHLHLRRLRTT